LTKFIEFEIQGGEDVWDDIVCDIVPDVYLDDIVHDI